MQAAATVHHLHVILVVVTLHSEGLSAGAAPRILRWRYKTGFASGASEKKSTPLHFSKCGAYKQANISRGLLNIDICCLVVALINIGRPRPMVL